jgi:hypothetical protein
MVSQIVSNELGLLANVRVSQQMIASHTVRAVC